MKIHNYGNDYIHANKLKEESVNYVGVQTAEDRQMSASKIQEETGREDNGKEETQKAEEKEAKRGRKKKQAD